MATEKVSLTLPEPLLVSAREMVGRRGLSRYVARALRNQLQRDRLTGLLEELEKQSGPISPRVLKEVHEAWPDPAPSGAARRDG